MVSNLTGLANKYIVFNTWSARKLLPYSRYKLHCVSSVTYPSPDDPIRVRNAGP